MAGERGHNGQFLPGWKGGPGRPKTPVPATPFTIKAARELCEQYEFSPLEKILAQCLKWEAQLQNENLTRGERYQLETKYAETLLGTMPYCYHKLQAVEHSGQIDLLQRLQAVSQCSDEELVRLIADTEAYLEQQS